MKQLLVRSRANVDPDSLYYRNNACRGEWCVSGRAPLERSSNPENTRQLRPAGSWYSHVFLHLRVHSVHSAALPSLHLLAAPALAVISSSHAASWL